MSDLTDLELCKRIADIENVTVRDTGEELEWVKCPKSAIEPKYDDYNPLTDDALCFHLMVKYDVNIDRYHDSAFILSEYTDRPHKSNVSFAIDMNVNRAILLAIVEANKS